MCFFLFFFFWIFEKYGEMYWNSNSPFWHQTCHAHLMKVTKYRNNHKPLDHNRWWYFCFFSVLHRLKNPPKMWLFCLPQSKSQTQMCIISYPSRWFYLTLNRSNCYSDLLITSCVPIKLQIQSFKPEHFEQQRIMYYLILRYFKTCRKNITASRLYWEIKLVILKISWLKPPEILKLKLILVVCSSEHIA